MQEQARLLEFLVQNSLSAPTQVFEECGVQSTPHLPTPMKTWPDWGLGQIEGLWIWVGPEYSAKWKLGQIEDFGFELV